MAAAFPLGRSGSPCRGQRDLAYIRKIMSSFDKSRVVDAGLTHERLAAAFSRRILASEAEGDGGFS
jgi:hypothetical protein